MVLIIVALAWMLYLLAAAQKRTRAAEADVRECEESKYRFLSSLSHEFRTPLNAVIGFSQFLTELDDAGDAKRRKEYLALIEAQGARLLQIVEDCLALARDSSGFRPKKSPVGIAAVLGELRRTTQSIAEARGIQLNFVFPFMGPNLSTHPGSIERLLLNLIINALKYGREEVLVEAVHRNDFWCISIIDDGPGLTDREKRDMFQPFNRLGREAGPVEGTGLGLPIAADLAARLDIDISVHSDVGVGTRIDVTVPVDGLDETPRRGQLNGATAYTKRPLRQRARRGREIAGQLLSRPLASRRQPRV